MHRISKKAIIICASAAVVLAAAVIFVIMLLSSGREAGHFTKTADPPTLVHPFLKRAMAIYRGTNKISGMQNIGEHCFNRLGSMFYICAGDLYIVSGNDVKKADTGVAARFYYAQNADVVYYFKGNDLYVYNGASDSSSRLGSVRSNVLNFVVSPDGTAAAWCEYERQFGNYYKGRFYACRSGVPVELNGIDRLLSISDGGSVIYAESETGYLLVSENFEAFRTVTKIGSAEYFSGDNTALLFTDEVYYNTYMYEPSLTEPVLVYEGNVSLITPSGYYYSAGSFDSFYASTNSGIFSGGNIEYFKRSGSGYSHSPFIVGHTYNVDIAGDEQYVVYTEYVGDKSYLFRRPTGGLGAAAKLIAEDVSTYVCDDDLHNIYYTTSDGSIWWSDGTKESCRKVCSEYVYGSLFGGGVFTFTDKNGVLYYSDKGSEPMPVPGVPAMTFISGEMAADENEMYWVTADGKTYINTGVTQR